jgi:hypothetical protein
LEALPESYERRRPERSNGAWPCFAETNATWTGTNTAAEGKNLLRLSRLTVKVTVEIAADFPDGASDQIKRAVSENATHLGFKNKMWEYVWIDLTRSFRNY